MNLRKIWGIVALLIFAMVIGHRVNSHFDAQAESKKVERNPSAVMLPESQTSEKKSLAAQTPCIGCVEGATNVIKAQIDLLSERVTRLPSELTQAARKVQGTFYQRCAAVEDEVGMDYYMDGNVGLCRDDLGKLITCSDEDPRNIEERFNHPAALFFDRVKVFTGKPPHRYLQPPRYYLPGCDGQQVNRYPPVFHLGCRPIVEVKNGQTQIKIFNQNTQKGKDKYTCIDCSSFVSTALAVAGLKITKAKDLYQPTTTSGFVNLGPSETDCLKPVEFSQGKTIQSGDVFAYRVPEQPNYGHSFIVDSVGPDPFRLKEIRSPSECSSINPQRFDFKIIHASGSAGRVGITRMKMSDYMSPRSVSSVDPVFVQIFYLAERACRAQFENPLPALVELETGSKRKIRTATFIRHVGKEVPGCSSDKPAVLVNNDKENTVNRCMDNCAEVSK